MSYYTEISDALAALGGSATPKQVRFALQQFDTRDIAAVQISEGNGSQPFDPSTLTGLALWLDASDGATINSGSPADADPVWLWADKSPNGYDATQDTADNRPTYNTVDGRATITFDDASFKQWLELATAGDLFRDTSDFTIAWAAKADGVGDGTILAASFSGDATSVRVLFGQPSADAATVTGSFDESTFKTKSVLNSVGYPVWLTVLLWATTAASNHCVIPESSGALLVPPTEADQLALVGPSPDTASSLVIVGADGTLAIDDHAALSELIVIAGIPNASDRRQLREYLAAKWATL